MSTTTQPPSNTASSTLNRPTINPLPTLLASSSTDREPSAERSASIESFKIMKITVVLSFPLLLNKNDIKLSHEIKICGDYKRIIKPTGGNRNNLTFHITCQN